MFLKLLQNNSVSHSHFCMVIFMSNSHPPLIFDRDLLMRNRQRAMRKGQDGFFLFENCATALFERLLDIRRPFSRILDMGGHNFSLLKNLYKQDQTRFMVHMGGNTFSGAYAYPAFLCQGDEEFLPFAASSFDLVISNLRLHWCNDLLGALIQIRQALRADGLLCAAIFGNETLHELRSCLYDAELSLRGGVSAHISPFANVQDCGGLLQRAQFTLPVVDKERITVMCRDIWHVMRMVRKMGEGNVLLNRDKRPLTREIILVAEHLYRDRFADDQGDLPVTFDVIFMAGWAMHELQQKPLKPGQATNRLAHALSAQEISTGEATGHGAKVKNDLS
jgi:SAM-dependent methyltransferase